MSKRLPVLSLLALSFCAAAPAVAAEEAVRELGQPDLDSFASNRVDVRGLYQPWGVAVDTSRSPNGIWVVDANNNRVLGWRNVAALSNGAPADVVLGQPDAHTRTCNTGGVSAASLCIVEGVFNIAYEPGLAVDGEGNVYVTDQVNQRILGYRRPFETDRVADVVLGQEGFQEAGPGITGITEPLLAPHGLATDAQGNLYVADHARVIEYDRPLATDNRLDRVLGTGQLSYADDLDLDAQGRLYVADGLLEEVLVWKKPLTDQGPADLTFSQGAPICPSYIGCKTSLAVEPDGDVWFGSSTRQRVFGYRSPVDTDTEPDQILTALGAPGSVPSGFLWIAGGGLDVDSTGTLWASDDNRVLGFFDPWNGHGSSDRILGQVRRDQIESNLVDRDGLRWPASIALDRSTSPARLYVVDAVNNRVLGWADSEGFANGQPADLVIGQPDRWSSRCFPGGLSLCLQQEIHGIAVDSRGTLWVSDTNNARVLGYDSPFTTDRVADKVLGGIGCAAGPRGLCLPGGLAVDRDDNLYVADVGNNRILELDRPMHRDAVADRVLGGRNFGQKKCTVEVSCFSEENHTHPGLVINGGSLAVDATGRLLVVNGLKVYAFARPLRAPAQWRKLAQLSVAVRDRPRALATDSASRIYLAGRSYVYRFPPTGGSQPSLLFDGHCTLIGGVVPDHVGPASICDAMGLAVAPDDDELFLSDAAANRVVVFELP
jgi:NHL repeat